MATLIVDQIDIKKLTEYIKSNLAAYAKPLFIRIGEVEHTGKGLSYKKNICSRKKSTVVRSLIIPSFR